MQSVRAARPEFAAGGTRKRMKAALLARLAKLENRPEMNEPAVMRYGWLKPLPAGFTGERHVAIIKREATDRPNIEWCEFEERVGPPPSNSDDGSFCIYMDAGEQPGRGVTR
jgi:hypothetical protein